MQHPADLTFDPPDNASWVMEAVHAPRPVATYGADNRLLDGLADGFRESAPRYGLLINGPELAVINRFVYNTIRPAVGSGGGAPPPKWIFKLLIRLHPELRRRRKAANAAFETKLWRQDLDRWDRIDKLASIQRHLQLLSVDPAALDDAGLIAYIDECTEQARRMAKQHHIYSPPAMGATGDFLAHVVDWTGLSVPDLLPLFQGASPVSTGWVPELDTLADALRADNDARALLESQRPPGEILRALADRPDPVGPAAGRYIHVVGYRIVGGYDIGDRCAIETPELLLAAIRRALTADRSDADTDLTAQREAETTRIRALVPAEHQAQFDELLHDALLTYRLRDERGLYSDVWATGILRRALLAAGDRLVERGRIRHREHIVETTSAEIPILLDGSVGPSADELADREQFRLTYTFRDAPAQLGADPSPPPPLDWLPDDGLRRIARATITIMANVFDDPELQLAQPSTESPTESPIESKVSVVRGKTAFVGDYEGIARIIINPDDFDRIEPGDVLIATSTSPSSNAVLPLVGAIVTDHGGVLSHAAIVAREYGVPCVVGCGNATTAIPDGARVRVQATEGTVTVLT